MVLFFPRGGELIAKRLESKEKASDKSLMINNLSMYKEFITI
jgi:hypothetical protein